MVLPQTFPYRISTMQSIKSYLRISVVLTRLLLQRKTIWLRAQILHWTTDHLIECYLSDVQMLTLIDSFQCQTTLHKTEINLPLKVLDTFGYCQRPVVSLGVFQHFL